MATGSPPNCRRRRMSEALRPTVRPPLSLCVGNKRSKSSCHRCIYANGHVLMWLMFVKHGANMGPGGALDLVRRRR